MSRKKPPNPHYARLVELVGRYVGHLGRGSAAQANLGRGKGRRLSEAELLTIRALISFISKESKAPEGTVEARVLAYFNIAAIEQIKAKDYDNAVRFLADFDRKLN